MPLIHKYKGHDIYENEIFLFDTLTGLVWFEVLEGAYSTLEAAKKRVDEEPAHD